jgi:CHASE3 domain sensor protein
MATDDRRKTLGVCQRVLATDDGQVLLAELRNALSPISLQSDNGTTLAYRAGQRDAFEYIRALADGDLNGGRQSDPELG